MECGANFAVILKDNAFFLPTEYKVLQSQKDGCFVKCMRMLYNGKTELYYFAGELKSLSSLLSTIDAERFLTVLCNLLGAIINVQSNGFLTCRNIDASFERIYIDPNTYKVSLVYLPLKEHLFDDDTAFENEIRTSLVKLIAGLAALSTQKMMQVSADLQNGSLNIESLYAKLSGKVASVQNDSSTQGNSAASGCRLKFIAMNAPARFEIVVNKSVFMIGKKDTNDGVITFNKMISRVHCKITSSRGQYWITDLQSSIVKITGQNIYNEAQLATSMTAYSVGTRIESDLRFRKDFFFEEFELSFRNQNGKWSITCSDNIFLDFGDIRKLATKQLNHGDIFSVKYQESGNEIFKIEFLLDFDNEEKDYTRIVDIQNIERIVIGAPDGANIHLTGEYLNKGCFELVKKSVHEYGLKILTPGYGIYHNGIAVKNLTTVYDGDFISIANYSFYLKGHSLYTSKTVEINGLDYRDVEAQNDYPKFNRNTRLKSTINEEKIEVLDPPKQPQKPTGNIFLQLLPALAMIALTIVVRGFMGNSTNSSFIIFSVCSMALGIATSVVSMISERKKYKREAAERVEKYNAYINKKREQISQYRSDELSRLNNLYIAPQEELENICGFSGDIFDKVIDDDDFLRVRLGLGTVEARRKISYKKQEKFESEDELATLPEEVSNDFRYIDNAPITLDLKNNNVVGVVGQSSECYLFVKNILLDIVARHYFKDVQVFFLISDSDVEKYSNWLKWLPHIVDEQTNTRNIVYSADSKSSVFERMYVEFGKRLTSGETCQPHYVVFVLNDWGIKTHPVAQYIPNAQKCNASYFFFENEKKDLPLWCSRIITLDSHCSGVMVSSGDRDRVERFTYDPIDDVQLLEAAKKLSPVYCEEISLENALTKNITLFEMLNILGVDDIDLKRNWAQAEIYKTMAAPLGVKTKDEIVYLDLHEKAHGPHGLVAGTTGSGKSEILQTYILSMAILYHPYEVGFVVIDFKGGGMVNQFKNLPHLIGAITNIDGKEINRSLMSIKAELENRQRIFAESNVNNISNYIKLYKAGKANIPIPHLIIVVDEFAELKAEQPEFMKELISAARIGRSLGVHLILATQKPAGQVNEQIWSNSKFKLCLKVQTKEDSNEVLKSPLAAEIKEPGRAYLQVGNNEIFELFQSAYSGAPARGEDATAEKEFVISEVDLQGKRHTIFQKVATHQNNVVATQLDAIATWRKKIILQLLPVLKS